MIGVNLSGAEFGKVGSAYGWSYIYPSKADLKFYTDRGVELVRLPVKWERLQPTANGDLDRAELGRLKKFLADAEALGAKVIVDVHNFGSYYGDKIGSAEVPNEQFAAFWKKLAAEIGDIDSVYGYDLMNEPNKMGSLDVWPAAAQAAVDAIRTVDMDTKIYVEGNSFAAAKNWSANNAGLDIQDPAGKIVYEAHIYFDRWSSGMYGESYDAQGATPDMGVKQIQDFLGWLADRGAEGFIGEFAVPDNDPRWLTVLDNFLTAVRDAGVDATYWGAGPWWGNYPLALQNKDGSESVQLDVLEKHVALAAAEETDVVSGSDDGLVQDGTAASETITGDGRANTLSGNQGNDVIEGGAGADRINGGTGIDTASYANSSEGVQIDLGAASQKGGDAQGDVLVGIENVTGSAFADVIKGNAGNNLLRGGAGDDRLLVSGGRDTMDGGEGSDTADFSTLTSRIVADLRTGLVLGSSGKVTLRNVENVVGTSAADTLTGDDRANVLSGGGGNDKIDGRAGADRLAGGGGNDTYFVDQAGDVVVEAANGGTDTVHSTAATFTLGAHIEKLVLAGAGGQTGIGNASGNTLTGSAGHATLEGAGGDDTIDGGAGADRMDGGTGNDVFHLDSLADAIVERAGEETDTVRASVSGYTLAANVEKLILSGSGNLAGTGNVLDNALTGNAGANLIRGGGGADRIDGGAGNDRLFGDDGDDTLTGGAGADQLTGGAGKDVFAFLLADSNAGAIDRITDFAAGTDRIDLSEIDARTNKTGNQSFSFIGTAAFSKSAGELRYQTAIDGDGQRYATVQGDVNGDGVADFALIVEQFSGALKVADFML